MDANQLMLRVNELQQAVEQSMANHNSLVGRLLEARELLQRMAGTCDEQAVVSCESEADCGIVEEAFVDTGVSGA